MHSTAVVAALLLGSATALAQGITPNLDAPDLWGKKYWTPGGPYKAGDSFIVKVTVENRGRAPALGAARGGYVVDLSLGVGPAGFPAAPHAVPMPYRFVEGMRLRGGRIAATVDLRPGAAREYGARVELPPDLKPGTYWLAVTVDPLNRVVEPQPHPNGEHDNISNLDIEIVR